MIPIFYRSTIRNLFGLIWLALLLAACRPGASGLSRPTGVAVAPDGSLFVMDHVDLKHSRVVHITQEGKTLQAFKPTDPSPGLVYAGWDMAVGPTGNVYYCNLVSNDAYKIHDGLLAFSPQGVFLFEIGGNDYTSDPNDVAASPYNLDVDDRGWVYVTDFNYNQLRIFDSQGQLRATINADNTQNFNFIGIGDVVLDDRRNLLYLTDFYDGRLDQYRLSIQMDGTIHLALQFSIGAFGHGPGELSFPQYLAVDEVTGFIYVGDMGNRRILVVDPRGNIVNEFAPPEEEWQVLGLAVGSDQTVYAADALNQVIWAFGPNGMFLRKIEVH